ncbi:MAG: polysaccharide biosynthesis tyrosine autokinase, partial [Longimicrobiales bacterium]
MEIDRSGYAHGDLETSGGGLSPHLSDYWLIISRRLWLVLLVFSVTTASAIWAVSRQRTHYRSTISLQVNDPLQRTRALNPTARISGMEIFVDPIESEIQVLTSATISLSVVDSLGLRLAPASPELVHSDLFMDAWADPSADPGSFELVYDESGGTVAFYRDDGRWVASGAVGSPLDAGFARFTPRPPPGEGRTYGVELLTVSGAVEAVRSRISAVPREYTNLIDVTFTTDDPVMAPLVLVQAAEALRRYGENKVSTAAKNEVAFIEQELGRAREQLQSSLEAIQRFKESQAFTSLSVQEQALVNEAQDIAREEDSLAEQRAVLSRMAREMERVGVSRMDLVEMEARLPAGVNPQLPEIIQGLQDDQDELRTLLREQRLTADHPSAQAIRTRIQEREGDLLEALQASLGVVESHLLDLRAQQEDLRERQRAFPELENQLQTLELNQETDQVTYEYLLAQLYQARIMQAAAEPYVDILDRPVGASEINPRGRMNILLGALLGLILGAGAAFFLEYLDRTVRTTAEVESFLGIPVLGIIPRLRRLVDAEGKEGGLPGGGPLVVALDALDPAAEAYRNLRMNLMFMSTADDPIRSVLFTSPGPSEGKSTTALNFSVMLAQQGHRVLLLDADLRRPALHKALDILREPGLTNLLVGNAELREVIRPNVLPNLDFLPSGPFPPNPSELLNSKAMERLLEALKGKYGHIILDSPPILAVTDSSVLGVLSDGVVVVLRSGETEQKAAERSVDQLRRIGVRIFGAVLNEVASSTPEESYYLQYYYSYRPGSDERRSITTKAARSANA